MAATGGVLAYLNARVADADGRTMQAAHDYARAVADAPDDPVIAIRAYRVALSAGDIPLAMRAAAVLVKAGVAPADTALFPLARAANAGDVGGVELAIATMSKGSLAVLAPSLRGWAAFARHVDPVRALATTDPVARRLSAETGVLLAIATGKDDGAAAFDALTASQAPVDTRIAAAQLAFAANHDDAARALVGNAPANAALRNIRGTKPTLGFGVSRLLTRVAGDLNGAASDEGGAHTLAIALTRAALIADPGYDHARLALAQALSRDGGTAEALAALDAIPTKSPFAGAAASARIGVLADAGRTPEALAVAKIRAEAPGAGPSDWQGYAGQLLAAKRPMDAAIWFRRVVDADPAHAWAAWLQYGGALDEAGDWARAEPALARAVELAPAEPVALNYLGYARIAHGGDKASATAMLERAHALAPDDGSITDSLGWAYFRGSKAARALPLLETAATNAPANAEIAEHLGDIYWTLGRRYEARYAWRAAALTAPPTDIARLAARIADGPPPVR